MGTGWTLVTFSIPEEQRTLRHHLRSTLTWAGFAALRDGLWLAPGEVDLASSSQPCARSFHRTRSSPSTPEELPSYPIADSVRAAWDIEAIRREHLTFIETWTDPASLAAGTRALSLRTMLVADWLALLQGGPATAPRVHGHALARKPFLRNYRRVHGALVVDSDAEFRALLTRRPVLTR